MPVRIYDAEKDPENKIALWETERPWEWLMSKKRVYPRALYNAQFRNDPSGLRGVRYDASWLQLYTEVDLPPLWTLTGVQGGDPATSERETSNYFGHCTAGRDSNTGVIYVLGFDYGHIPAPDHLQFLKGEYDAWSSRGLHISKVVLETVGPQQGTTQHLVAQTRLDPTGAMPIDTITPKGSKEQRFDAIMPFLKTGTVRFRGERDSNGSIVIAESGGFKEFLQEYTRFPRGGRDDILDALWIVINELTQAGDAIGVVEERGKIVKGEGIEKSFDESLEERKARIELALEEYDRRKEGEKVESSRERVLRRRSFFSHG